MLLLEEARTIESHYPLYELEKGCLLGADRIMTGSHVLRNQLHLRGANEKRVELVRPLFDTSSWKITETTSKFSQTVLYLGKFKPWEAGSTLIMAISFSLDGILRLFLL